MLTQNQLLVLAAMNTAKLKNESFIIANENINKNNTDLSDIRWVWPQTITILFENWIYTVDDLKRVWLEKVKTLIKSPVAIKPITNFFDIWHWEQLTAED